MSYVLFLPLCHCLATKLTRQQDEERNYKLPEEEVATIKQELISLMISVPPNLQAQLGEAISLIADSDFWDRWETLVDVCQMLVSSAMLC